MSRLIVYTTIFGASDSLKQAPSGADRCVCFVDDPWNYSDTKGWDIIGRPDVLNPRRDAWQMRSLPHQLSDLGEYHRVIWIDASFTLTDLPRLLKDAGKAPIAALRHHKRNSYIEESNALVQVKQATKADSFDQVSRYLGMGFSPGHLSISCVIVRDRSEAVQQFNETWDREIQRHPGDNTQVSIDYAAWKHGMTIKALQGGRHENPYATHDARDHRRRRQPYPGQPAELNR